ncbi:MAG: Ig-like domain-containing protein, partial [Lachnospiraceae bacterium]|nr:Ig-like domain-containing protein [Lachnospiraceae bacterium]
MVTVIVIDTIALSASNLTIPVGGSVDLNAVATDVSTSDSWQWTSDNTSIATVAGDGVSAVVK